MHTTGRRFFWASTRCLANFGDTGGSLRRQFHSRLFILSNAIKGFSPIICAMAETERGYAEHSRRNVANCVAFCASAIRRPTSAASEMGRCGSQRWEAIRQPRSRQQSNPQPAQPCGAIG
jgi:hypothetical protein